MPGPRNNKRVQPKKPKTKAKAASKATQFELAALTPATIPITLGTLGQDDVYRPSTELCMDSVKAVTLEVATIQFVSSVKETKLAVEQAPTAEPVPAPAPAPAPVSPSALELPHSTLAEAYPDGLPPPCIEDPGTGPRVRDAKAFLASPFAVRTAHAEDAPLCAEMAQEEVLAMIMELLPEELAQIVWYNRTRRTSRVCPACQRLYTLGDLLLDHAVTQDEVENPDDPDHIGTRARMGTKEPSPQLQREQALSGLCSPVCFALAAYNHPAVAHAVWGSSGPRPWRLLCPATNKHNQTQSLLPGNDAHDDSKPSPQLLDEIGGLGLAVRMTRRADLGLGILLGLNEGLDGEVEDNSDPHHGGRKVPADEDYEDGGWEEWNAPIQALDA